MELKRRTRSAKPIDAFSAPAKRPRWPRRALISVSVLLVPALVLGGAGWFYVNYQLGKITRIHVSHLVTAKPGQPMNILLIGSDSRSFVGDNQKLASEVGSGSWVTGQRSDVIIVVRLVPKTTGIEMLSIPRDTWVPIAGAGTSNRINAALNTGPGELVQTIEQDFHIPINHFVEANFPGFTAMVSALGGIHLNFPERVKDNETGLNIKTTGCQLVTGPQALQLVRSRDLWYYAHGQWNYDGMGDYSRIRRQQAFFHAVINQADAEFPNVLAIDRFISAATHAFAVDSGFSSGLMRDLALQYRGVASSHLDTNVLVNTEAVYQGADILLPVWRTDRLAVDHFLSFGTTPVAGHTSTSTSPTTSTSTTTTTTLPVTGTTSVPVVDNSKNYPEPWNPVPC
jgi:LCP family protein required for cell wall assembly